MKEAVLFLCHFVTDNMLVRFGKLNKDLSGRCDVFWALQYGNDVDFMELQRRNIRVFNFSLHELNSLNYSPITESVVSSNVQLVPTYFYKCHPEYDYYWLVKYDVVLTGDWMKLIGAFEKDNTDFLISHIEHFCDTNKEWPLWKYPSLRVKDETPVANALKALTPVYRFSNQALHFLDGFLQDKGINGHFEMIIATLLKHYGYTIRDFEGTEELTLQKIHNNLHFQGFGLNNGTMQWSPTYIPEKVEGLDTKDKFHPTKEIQKRKTNDTMRHAILIMGHKNIDHICKIAAYFNKQCDLFIHIDKKTHLNNDDIERLRCYNQVKSISQEFDVNWGGTSVLDCELNLLQKAYNSGDYDYFHLISGQDYPVRPLQDFLEYFERINGKSLIQYVKLPHPNWEKGTFRRLQYYYPYDYATGKEDPRKWVRNQVRNQILKGAKRPIPDEFDYLYGSSQWFSIHRVAAKILID